MEEALPLDDLSEKFKAFNWDCDEVIDGHSFNELVSSLKKPNRPSKPRALIINTVKGKGIKSFENDPAWHARKIKDEELEIGKIELGIT